MVKTTMTEAKNNARFTDFKSLKKYLTENNLQVLNIEKIAYTAGIYGCNGYLLRIETIASLPIYAFTGRSTWMYNCTSLSQYNEA